MVNKDQISQDAQKLCKSPQIQKFLQMHHLQATFLDENIIELFFVRSEQGIRELDTKYGKDFHNLSYHIVGSRQDAEECVNDAYLGAWNAIPPARPNPLLTYICKIVRNISLKVYYRKINY